MSKLADELDTIVNSLINTRVEIERLEGRLVWLTHAAEQRDQAMDRALKAEAELAELRSGSDAVAEYKDAMK